MGWIFQEVSESQAPDVLNVLHSKLNALEPMQRTSCKLAASDMKGKDARGVLIYDNNPQAFEPVDNAQWQMQEYKTGSDYNQLYSQATQFLNGLTVVQAQNARLVFTNAASHDATLTIYFPE